MRLVIIADNILSNLEPLHYLLYLIVVFGVGLLVGMWVVKKNRNKKKTV